MSREEKIVIDERDYGYDHEKAFNMVKTRAPAAQIDISSRNDVLKTETHTLGPGQYDSSAMTEFGRDTKSVKFLQSTREVKMNE